MKVNNFDNPVIDRKGDVQTLEEYSERNNVIMSDEFIPDKTYNPGDFVIYKNTLWECLITCIGVIPTEGLHWTKTSLGKVTSSLSEKIVTLSTISSDENECGYWGDKKLYRKIVTGNCGAYGTWNTIYDVGNGNTIVDFNAYAEISSGYEMKLPYYDGTTNGIMVARKNNNQLVATPVSASTNNKPMYAIIYYVKT